MKKRTRKYCLYCKVDSVPMECALCDGTGRIYIASDLLLGIGPNDEEKFQECDQCNGVGFTLVPPHIKDLFSKR